MHAVVEDLEYLAERFKIPAPGLIVNISQKRNNSALN